MQNKMLVTLAEMRNEINDLKLANTELSNRLDFFIEQDNALETEFRKLDTDFRKSGLFEDADTIYF
jgi:hypothetical protein